MARGRIDAEQAALTTSRVTASDQPRDARQAGLVLEVVVEDLEVKRQVFERLDREVPPSILLATDTSSLRCPTSPIGSGTANVFSACTSSARHRR